MITVLKEKNTFEEEVSLERKEEMDISVINGWQMRAYMNIVHVDYHCNWIQGNYKMITRFCAFLGMIVVVIISLFSLDRNSKHEQHFQECVFTISHKERRNMNGISLLLPHSMSNYSFLAFFPWDEIFLQISAETDKQTKSDFPTTSSSFPRMFPEVSMLPEMSTISITWPAGDSILWLIILLQTPFRF